MTLTMWINDADLNRLDNGDFNACWDNMGIAIPKDLLTSPLDMGKDHSAYEWELDEEEEKDEIIAILKENNVRYQVW